MASEWREITLGEAGVELFDCDHRTPPAAEEGFPYVAIPELQDGRIKLSEARKISHAHYTEWTRKTRPMFGDIILSRRCNPGETAFVSTHAEFALGQNLVLLRADGKSCDAHFLRWAVRSPAWWEQISKFINVGAVFESLRCKDILRFSLPFPPIAIQRQIAVILGCLDAKVELIHLQNILMEAVARAIFKSWFVDFDPVRAKAEGREPEGMDAATAALFPSEYGGNNLPLAWTHSTLGEIADIIDCLHSKKPDRCEHGLPFLQLSNIAADGILDMRDVYLISESDYSKWTARIEATGGDCVITNVGRVGAIAQIPDAYKAALGRNMTGIRCKPTFCHPTLLLQLLTSDAMRDEIELRTDSGTILESLNVRSIPKLRFVRPTVEVATRFEELCRPLRQRIELGVAQSRVIAELRDTLLPRLISGKLRVPEAEKLVEAVL